MQGKCPKCQIAYRFSSPRDLKDAYCPKCGTKLSRTTYLYKGEWRDVNYAYPPNEQKGKAIYRCECGEVYESTIHYKELTCLRCGKKIPRA